MVQVPSSDLITASSWSDSLSPASQNLCILAIKALSNAESYTSGFVAPLSLHPSASILKGCLPPSRLEGKTGLSWAHAVIPALGHDDKISSFQTGLLETLSQKQKSAPGKQTKWGR